MLSMSVYSCVPGLAAAIEANEIFCPFRRWALMLMKSVCPVSRIHCGWPPNRAAVPRLVVADAFQMVAGGRLRGLHLLLVGGGDPEHDGAAGGGGVPGALHGGRDGHGGGEEHGRRT